MTPAELHHASAELDFLRRRIALVFWTITMTLALIVLIAITLSLLVSMITGVPMAADHIAVGAGITGASAGGRHIPSLLQHLGRREPPT